MEIKLSNLKTEIKKLNKTIMLYDECMSNLCNITKNSTLYWKDYNTDSFTKDLSVLKLNIEDTINNLNKIKNIFSLLVDSYEKLGRKIRYSLNHRETINNKINSIIYDIDKSILRINGLDYNFDNYVRYIIEENKNKLKSVQKNTKNYKKKINKIFDEISNIEREVKYKLSKIELNNITENNIDDYI